jgi:hypothetical protein
MYGGGRGVISVKLTRYALNKEFGMYLEELLVRFRFVGWGRGGFCQVDGVGMTHTVRYAWNH